MYVLWDVANAVLCLPSLDMYTTRTCTAINLFKYLKPYVNDWHATAPWAICAFSSSPLNPAFTLASGRRRFIFCVRTRHWGTITATTAYSGLRFNHPHMSIRSDVEKRFLGQIPLVHMRPHFHNSPPDSYNRGFLLRRRVRPFIKRLSRQSKENES